VLPVHHRLSRTLGVFTRGVLPLKLLGARGEQDELREISIQHGKVRELLGVEVRGHVRAVRLQERRSARHLDLLGDLAQFQGEIHRRLRVDVHDDLGQDGGLETRQLGFDLVGAGDKTIFHVDSGFVRDRRIDSFPIEIRHRDRGAGNGGSGRILHDAADAAVDGLSCGVRNWRDKGEAEETCCRLYCTRDSGYRRGDGEVSHREPPSGGRAAWRSMNELRSVLRSQRAHPSTVSSGVKSNSRQRLVRSRQKKF
jgi:hypothetical protein